MRSPFLFTAIGAFLAAILFIVAEQHSRVQASLQTEKALEQVILAQNQFLSSRVVEGLQKAERDALLVLQKNRKNQKTKLFQSDTFLSEPELPKWILVSGYRFRAAGIEPDSLLEEALAKHMLGDLPLALVAAKNKNYLLVKGVVGGNGFASAYDPEKFFSYFKIDSGTRVWITLADGTVVYHPVPRFIGSNASNLKPVAAGMKELIEGRPHTFRGTYLGLEAKEAIGVWSALPSHQILVGNEWTHPTPNISLGRFGFFALLATFFGALSLGLLFRKKEDSTQQQTEFPEHLLEHEIRDYVESMRSVADRARLHADLKDRELAELQNKTVQVGMMSKELDWKLEVHKNFLDLMVASAEPWNDFLLFSRKHFPLFSLLLFRYSPTSFSLVADEIEVDANILRKEGKATELSSFLATGRIYLGSNKALQSLAHTESFRSWTRKWVSLEGNSREFVPYQVRSLNGEQFCLLVSFESSLNRSGELKKSLEIWEELLIRNQGFCDSFSQLLQSKYAKVLGELGLPAKENLSRNQPRPS